MTPTDEIAALRRELAELIAQAGVKAADPKLSDEEWARGCKTRTERRAEIHRRLRELESQEAERLRRELEQLERDHAMWERDGEFNPDPCPRCEDIRNRLRELGETP